MSLIIVNEDSLDVSQTAVPLTSFCYHMDAGGVHPPTPTPLLARQHVGQGAGSVGRLPWELGCVGRADGWWVGLFVCSQLQVIKGSGVSLLFSLRKG